VVEAWARSLAQSSYARITEIEGWGGTDDFDLKRGSQADPLRGVARFAMKMADDFVQHDPAVVVSRDICIAGALCDADHVGWMIACSMGLLDPKSIANAGPKMKPRRLLHELPQAAT
jgi:hypothetical protein